MEYAPAQVPEKVVQESDDLDTGDVDAVQTEIKSKPLPQRGYGDGRDGFQDGIMQEQAA